MQNLTFYALANSTLGIVRDSVNARNMPPPTFTRRFAVTLNLRLFSEPERDAVYPISLLQEIASWQCVFDKDFASATPPIIVADNEDILCHSVTETIDGIQRTYTEIVIPISNMNTEAIATYLGNDEFKNGLVMEIIGFDDSDAAVWGLQIKNFTIRNCVFVDSGAAPGPNLPDDRLLTMAQADQRYARTGVDIETSTASALAIAPGHAYAWTPSSNATLSLGTGFSSEKEAYVSLTVSPGAHSVTLSSDFDSASSDALAANKKNICVIRWNGSKATLYKCAEA